MTEVLRERPGWEGEPPEAPGRTRGRAVAEREQPPPDEPERLF